MWLVAIILDSTALYCIIYTVQKKTPEVFVFKVTREVIKVKECVPPAIFTLVSLPSLEFYFKEILELNQP